MTESFFDRITKSKTKHNPDILSCLANLSNDEVFTPPEIADKMLDMLPQELFENPNTTFFDPACKTGIFLREIAKRLIVGLEKQIPDLQERIDHIFHKQLYGIAITELTSLLSRRSLYCSKSPDGRYSVTEFDDPEGNIRFKRIQHTWSPREKKYDSKGKIIGKCIFCGASREQYDRTDDLETHAYEFLHTYKPEELFNMKFDVIISNPPYHLSDGGAQASAKPIYNLFVEQSKKLNPKYLCMIIPSRWMTGGKGLDKFRDEMIHDKRFVELHDFIDSSECFSGVDIKGGVCYFLWDKDFHDKCKIFRKKGKDEVFSKRYLVEDNDSVFIRYGELIPIKDKVKTITKKSFEILVSPRKPYGLSGDVFGNYEKYDLPEMQDYPINNGYRVYGLELSKRAIKFATRNYPITKNNMIDRFKLFVTRNYGSGEFGEIAPLPIIGDPYDICTETFIQIGPFDNKNNALNALHYFATKFFRAMVGIKKHDQGAPRSIYQFVPMQDFTNNSDIDWSKPIEDIDRQLYRKYNLSQKEIDFIETAISTYGEEE